MGEGILVFLRAKRKENSYEKKREKRKVVKRMKKRFKISENELMSVVC